MTAVARHIGHELGTLTSSCSITSPENGQPSIQEVYPASKRERHRHGRQFVKPGSPAANPRELPGGVFADGPLRTVALYLGRLAVLLIINPSDAVWIGCFGEPCRPAGPAGTALTPVIHEGLNVDRC
jgi:hypothetical protein